MEDVMALLKMVPPDQAEGKLAELYGDAEKFFGMVPNNVRLFGVSSDLLENQVQFATYFMKHPRLSAPLLAMIRMLAAHASDSHYCAKMNTAMLIQKGITLDQVEEMKSDPGKAPLDGNEKAMLIFILKAIRDPHAISAAEIDDLRVHGWSDKDIIDGLAHGARAVATNLLFDAFKLESD